MNHIITGVQIVGCIAVAYFAVRGFLASLYDFTAWNLRRAGIDPDRIDRDPREFLDAAVEHAREMVREHGLEDRVEVVADRKNSKIIVRGRPTEEE